LKFVYADYDLSVEFEENKVNVLVIESPTVYSKLINDLIMQTNGDLGGFVLSEAESILKIDKEIEFIFNPFTVDLNNRKILNKLYQELNSIGNEELIEETYQVHGKIIDYLDVLSNKVPYNLKFNLEMDIPSLLKAYSLEIDESGESLLNKLVDYIRAMHQICRISIFIFLNIKQYLTDMEIQQLYEFVFYEKVNILLLESKFDKQLSNECVIILDKDLCQIFVN
jgi:CRISPR-associated protein Csn2